MTRPLTSVPLWGVYAVWALLLAVCLLLAWVLSPSAAWRALSISVVVMFWIDVLHNLRHIKL